MKKILAIAFVGAAFSLVACGGNPPSYNETVSAPVNMPASTPVVTQGDTSNVSVVTNPANAAPGVNQQTAVQPPAAQPGKQQAATAKGMNPAHGQPGHRCDIPVGAPLSTPPAANSQVQQVQPINATPQQAVGPQITPIEPPKSSALPSTSGKRLNPAHGQPGHDCAVPVGAPLN